MLSDLHRVLAPRLADGVSQLCRASYLLTRAADELHAKTVDLLDYVERWEYTLTGPDGWPE